MTNSSVCKFLICVVVLLCNICMLKGQSESEIREYFKREAANLNPIEGVWDVEAYICGSNAFITYPPKKSNTELYIYKISEGVYKTIDEQFTITQIGSTNAYNLKITWPDAPSSNVRFYLRDGIQFGTTWDIPIAQMKADMGRNYQAGYKINIKWNCIKNYPTAQMYQKAIEEERAKKAAEEMANTPSSWTGTGFALKNGYIATNYHVVDGAKSIAVQGVKGNFNEKYNAEVVSTDKYNDLALLKISDTKFNGFGNIPYNVKTTVSDVGEEIFVLGYPLTSTMGDEIKLTTGVISSKTGYQGDVSLYQISAPIQPGNSGGPLFDNKGNLVGIVNAKHKGTENVGYAIKTSYLKNLIESSISTPILPNNNQTAGLPLTGKVKSLKNYVFMITCNNATFSTNNLNKENKDKIVINNPTVTRDSLLDSWHNTLTRISKITLEENVTIVELSLKNYRWCQIEPCTYIMAEGTKFTMLYAKDIAIAPQKTYPSYRGGEITCKLYFPPLPKGINTIDLIESDESRWKFYGIKLN